MTPPCPAPAGMRWAVIPADGAHPTAGVLVSTAGVRLVVARDGDGWAVYHATGTILRDGVTSTRLPEVVGALVGADLAPDPTADRAQVRALGERP